MKLSRSNASYKSTGGEQPQHTPQQDSFSSSSFHLQSSLDHVRLPFAYKLHLLLCDMEVNSCEHIISWVEDGNAFKIHDRKKFEELIQPHYFRQSTITSFIRQCYAYGFSKLEFGPGRGSYFHPKFQRSNQSMSLAIQRHSRLNQGILLQPATRRNITPPCDNNSCYPNHHHDDLAPGAIAPSPTRGMLSSDRTSLKLNSKSINEAGELLLVEELFRPYVLTTAWKYSRGINRFSSQGPSKSCLNLHIKMINGHPRMSSQLNQSTRYYECAMRKSIDTVP